MKDPKLDAKAKRAVAEARMMRQHPGIRPRTRMSSLLIALLVFVVFIFVAVRCLDSTPTVESEELSTNQDQQQPLSRPLSF